ncbi:UDP-GalNAc:beta-1,3-N-acetylgalactosaminyltransferase 1 [Agelaius phoeniceus]|uniref:UDP-GalNAc:beta-1, 3-N-acetylgalactosaminyltransferase 1 n=1 Tax=Agelaius phoeniceus TaxID=39638 RepID=UPI004054DF55
MIPVLINALCMRPLKWIFVCLVVFSTITVWYIMSSPRAALETVNPLYFYEYEPVHRQPRPFTLRPRPTCTDLRPFLVILVASSPGDLKARQAIRITWGSRDSWWGQRILTLFLLGQDTQREDRVAALAVEDESILYGDIIRQDFVDTYDNLTLKTIMAFQWFSEFCSSARFFMKTDADVFINTPNLVQLLLQLNSSENVFTGYPLIDNFAYRGADRKRFISYQEYPFRLYPPYCSGLGYILDGKLALRTYELMSHVRPLKFEDVYVGICLNILKVNITLPQDAEQFFLYKIDFDICKYRRLIAVHGLTSSELIQFWQDLSANTSKPCL